jgi:hypothetical protein
MRRRRSSTRRSAHRDTSILPNPKTLLDTHDDQPRQRQPLTPRTLLPHSLRSRINPQEDVRVTRHGSPHDPADDPVPDRYAGGDEDADQEGDAKHERNATPVVSGHRRYTQIEETHTTPVYTLRD